AFAPDGRVLASGGWDGTVLVWDVTGMLKNGRLPSVALKPDELEPLWQELMDEDARNAHEAVWRLAAAGPQAVPFLRERLHPVPAADLKRVARLIADLDHDSFAVRDRATEELAGPGEGGQEPLRQGLAGRPSVEARVRLQRLLKPLGDPLPPPERLRPLRALAVLEQAGTPEAKQVLEALARGSAGAPLTREAKAALERLTK